MAMLVITRWYINDWGFLQIEDLQVTMVVSILTWSNGVPYPYFRKPFTYVKQTRRLIK